jgi:hypothetical protein
MCSESVVLKYLSCSQKLAKSSMDYRHFGYVTKLTPKKPIGSQMSRKVPSCDFHPLSDE